MQIDYCWIKRNSKICNIFIKDTMSKIFNKKKVKFIKKRSTYIGKNVKFGENVIIEPNNYIDGDCYIGDNSHLYPNNFITDCKIGKNCSLFSSHLENSIIKDDVTIGPFARIRPHSIIYDKVKIGNFVEIKNSIIKSECKISHLAYVGDCDMGEKCNIGCGVIFANYNGKTKSRTRVGNHVFIGSNCNIIAPVVIDSNSYICAGTTVTDKVADGDFVIGRVRQENKAKRAKKYW